MPEKLSDSRRKTRSVAQNEQGEQHKAQDSQVLQSTLILHKTEVLPIAEPVKANSIVEDIKISGEVKSRDTFREIHDEFITEDRLSYSPPERHEPLQQKEKVAAKSPTIKRPAIRRKSHNIIEKQPESKAI